ncbi:MAG TPA: class I SAM-dependent methyltransferase [Bryobacteraceae bacterium]|nr:class I SAM-dependent methyltransferase [Bryobacteraceae bacterium]
MQKNWYETFFHGVALDMWRNAVTPEQTRMDADFLEQELALTSGARVLDVPCGNGRHSLELAGRSYQLTGVDFAPEFIEEARGKDPNIEWRLGDMRALPSDGQFDAAFCFGNSFGYLDRLGNRAFIAALAGALKLGGRVALETGIVAESLLPSLQRSRWFQVGGIIMLSSNTYEPYQSRLDIEYTFIRNGTVDTRRISQHVYTVAEIRELFEDAGLRTLALYGGVDRQTYQLGSQRLIILAQKQ